MAGIHGQEQSKVSMRPDDLRLAILVAVLIDDQVAVELEQRVEAVEHGGAAQVSIVEDEPLTLLDCVDEHAVDPLEAGGGGLVRLRDQELALVDEVGDL